MHQLSRTAPALLLALVAAAPAPDLDDASLARQILKEIEVPPFRKALRPKPRAGEASLSTRPLERYREDRGRTPLRSVTEEAHAQLVRIIREGGLPEEFDYSGKTDMLQAEILGYQKRSARLITRATESLEGLKRASQERDREPSPRWRAHYDYLVARYELQLAYLYEYSSTLGSLRKELPALDAPEHNGWRLVARENMQGDAEGRQHAREGRRLLEKIVKEYAGTPWEYLAREDLAMPVGMYLQSARIK